MPRLAAPPTPQPSTEIASKRDVSGAVQFDNFTLPPAALGASGSARESTRSASTASNASDSSYHPVTSPSISHPSKSSASASRKRSIAVAHTAEADGGYTLPPPPTRSRKIIQMKPKGQAQQQAAPSSKVDEEVAPTNAASSSKASAAAATGGSRKKQGNGTTAAGRKIARKTAHSLIERRRRSKMNEEFSVLKNMIPACTGHEMHKLAILQASIEYMRYLEKCVSDMKASHVSHGTDTKSHPPSPHDSVNDSPDVGPVDRNQHPDLSDEDDEDEDEDEDMSDAVSPTTIPKTLQPSPALHHAHSANTSPAIYPADRVSSAYGGYSAHTSPAIQPSDPRHYSITSSIRSTVTSPAINPSPSILPSPAHSVQLPSFSVVSNASGAGFTLTSPALRPIDHGVKEGERESEDHEATAALLMLNSDRRSWTGRALGVKDLLSN